MPPDAIVLDGSPLSIEQVEGVARRDRLLILAPQAREAMTQAREALTRRLATGETMYGINTGFGSLSRVRIDAAGLRDVQRNLIRSHAAGVGEPLPRDVVRAMMAILAASLARGASGVRPACVDSIITLLERDITPVVPSRGSVGASGDLAPLSHIALAMIGEGRATYGGASGPTGRFLVACGIEPLVLEAKEGLALINGTHLMSAMAALALADVARLADAAVAAAALSIDACRATDAFLDPRLHEARRQPGQRDVAARMKLLLAGSTILAAHKENDPRVQDPYCLRASPQVIGAALDAIGFVREVVQRELGAVTDNPLVFTQGDRCDVISGGNFHGMPLAIAMDVAKIALAHVAGISERRVNWVVSAVDAENPVPSYLSPKPGLHSGLMIAQYAAAACCNELQTLAHPASVHNVTTSAGIEDYNSFGATSALQLRQAVELATHVIAIELMVMTEAMEYQRPLRSGAGVERTVAAVRAAVPKLVADRPPAPDIAAVAGLIRDGRIVADTAGFALSEAERRS